MPTPAGRPTCRLPRRPPPRAGLIVLLGLLAAVVAGCDPRAGHTDGPWPAPEHSPREVVELQLAALRQPGGESGNGARGYEVAFRFASPENRDGIGALDGFRELLQAPVYAPLTNHVRVRTHRESRRDGHAFVPVEVTATDGRRSGYLYALSRQAEGRWKDCWMIDGVVPIDLDRIFDNPELTTGVPATPARPGQAARVALLGRT